MRSRTLFFALTLLASSAASAATVTLQRGQTAMLGDSQVTLISLKDSRCPMNARCIQAGELTVSVLVSKDSHLRLLKLTYPPQDGAAASSAGAGLHIQAASETMAGSKAPIQVTLSDQP